MSRSPLLPEWTIEQALSEDAAGIAVFHSESFRKTYLKVDDEVHNLRVIEEATNFVTPERIELRAKLIDESLLHPDIHFYHIAMREDDQPIGLIYGTKEVDKQEIYALYVDKRYHRKGIGKTLVQEFIQWADPNRPI